MVLGLKQEFCTTGGDCDSKEEIWKVYYKDGERTALNMKEEREPKKTHWDKM